MSEDKDIAWPNTNYYNFYGIHLWQKYEINCSEKGLKMYREKFEIDRIRFRDSETRTDDTRC